MGPGARPGAAIDAMTAVGPVWDGVVSTPVAPPSPAPPGTTALPEAGRRALDRPEALPSDPDAGRPQANVTYPAPALPQVEQGPSADGLRMPLILENRGSDPSLTRPTGEINGKPTGPRSAGRERLPNQERASTAEKAQVDSENRVVDAFAAAGYRTVQNPTRGPNPALTRERMVVEGLDPKKNPDQLVEGRIYDTYTPLTNNIRGIWKGIEAKIAEKQTHRVAVDLTETTQTEAAVRAALRDNPIPGLKEIVFYTKDSVRGRGGNSAFVTM